MKELILSEISLVSGGVAEGGCIPPFPIILSPT